MTTFIQFTVVGIVSAAIYAITATGLVVTYTTTGVFNFAQGAVGMIAAFSFWQFWQDWGWAWWLALIVVLLEAVGLAIVVEFGLMRRLHGATTERSLMVTLGLLTILIGVASGIWGNAAQRVIPPAFVQASGDIDKVGIFGVQVTYQQIMTVVIAVVIAIGLRYMFSALRIGVAMRAVVDDPELLALSGAKPYRVSQMGWALGFVLGAISGILLAQTLGASGLNIDTLTLLVVNGYAAAVVGRLKSIPMTLLGALILGLTYQYCAGYLPLHVNPNLAEIIPVLVPIILLFVVLLIIPAARLVAVGRLPVAGPPKVATVRQAGVGGAALLVMAVIVAFVVSGTALLTISEGMAMGIVALSLVLLTGYGGQVSLCQLTFAGIGAYTMGKVAGGGSWWGVIAALVVSAVVGALVALPALRLRGLYLALATLAFAEAMSVAFFGNNSYIPEGQSLAVKTLDIPGLGTPTPSEELIVITVAFLLCAGVVLGIRRNVFGRRLVAMSDSPTALATLGLSSAKTKVIVFSLSSAMAALGGVFYAPLRLGLSADDVAFLLSLTLLLFVAIWGIRTLSGALLGGLTAVSLPELSTHLPAGLVDMAGLVAGIGIIILSRSPDGVLGLARKLLPFQLPFSDKSNAEPRVVAQAAGTSSQEVAHAS